MKRIQSAGTFLCGLLVGGVLFGGGVAYAAGVMAERSAQPIYVDGKQVQMEAYSIGGNNYVKLRDVGRAVDFGVTYDGATNSVYMDSTAPYTEEIPTVKQATQAEPDGSGAVSSAPFTTKVLTGDDKAREDFSQSANPAIFIGDYTRAAYNAARQSVIDRDTILAGNNEDGFHPRYAYAHATATAETRRVMNGVLSRIGSYYWYSISAEPYLKFYYNYPDYFIIAPQIPASSVEAKGYTDNLIAEVNDKISDAEKVWLMNDYLCDRMIFDRKATAPMTEIFASAGTKVAGKCTTFAYAFQYLCDRAGVPCIKISSTDHTWNAVYVDGQWLHVDVSLNTQATSRSAMLLTETSRKTDATPSMTLFAKELLVPGSTK